MSKIELIVIDWNKKQIYHNNVLFTRLSFILAEKLEAYDIQSFRIYNAEYDGTPLSKLLFIELNANSSHLDMLEKQLEFLHKEWSSGFHSKMFEDILEDQITTLTEYLADNKKEGV